MKHHLYNTLKFIYAFHQNWMKPSLIVQTYASPRIANPDLFSYVTKNYFLQVDAELKITLSHKSRG